MPLLVFQCKWAVYSQESFDQTDDECGSYGSIASVSHCFVDNIVYTQPAIGAVRSVEWKAWHSYVSIHLPTIKDLLFTSYFPMDIMQIPWSMHNKSQICAQLLKKAPPICLCYVHVIPAFVWKFWQLILAGRMSSAPWLWCLPGESSSGRAISTLVFVIWFSVRVFVYKLLKPVVCPFIWVSSCKFVSWRKIRRMCSTSPPPPTWVEGTRTITRPEEMNPLVIRPNIWSSSVGKIHTLIPPLLNCVIQEMAISCCAIFVKGCEDKTELNC